MPELNDEQALSYAESMTNWVKGLKYLEDVIRYARNSKETLKQQLRGLEDQIATTRQEAERLPHIVAKAKADLASFETAAVARRNALEMELHTLQQSVEPLRKTVKELTGTRDRLHADTRNAELALTDVQARANALSATEADLRQKINRHEQRMAELRQMAAKLVDG